MFKMVESLLVWELEPELELAPKSVPAKKNPEPVKNGQGPQHRS